MSDNEERDPDSDGRGRPKAATTDEILRVLETRERPVLTVSEITERVDASRWTVQERLKDLESRDEATRITVGRADGWYLPGDFEYLFSSPGAEPKAEAIEAADGVDSAGEAAEGPRADVEDDPDVAPGGGVVLEGDSQAVDLLREMRELAGTAKELEEKLEQNEQRLTAVISEATGGEETTEANVLDYARGLSREERERLSELVAPYTPSKRKVARESPGRVFASVVLGTTAVVTIFFAVGLSFLLFVASLSATYTPGRVEFLLLIADVLLYGCAGGLAYISYTLYQVAHETAISKLDTDGAAEELKN